MNINLEELSEAEKFQVQELYNRIMGAYAMARSHGQSSSYSFNLYEPSSTRPAATTAAINASIKCLKHKMNPELYVQALQKHCKATGLVFYPTSLNLKNSIEVYDSYVKTAIEANQDYAASYDVQLKYLYDALTTKRKTENILLDSTMPFSAWFRICVTSESDPDIIDKFLAEAKVTLTPGLVKFLTDKKLNISRLGL